MATAAGVATAATGQAHEVVDTEGDEGEDEEEDDDNNSDNVVFLHLESVDEGKASIVCG